MWQYTIWSLSCLSCFYTHIATLHTFTPNPTSRHIKSKFQTPQDPTIRNPKIKTAAAVWRSVLPVCWAWRSSSPTSQLPSPLTSREPPPPTPGNSTAHLATQPWCAAACGERTAHLPVRFSGQLPHTSRTDATQESVPVHSLHPFHALRTS